MYMPAPPSSLLVANRPKSMDDPAQQDEAFHTFLQTNGLMQSRDFKFAFTCAEEAAEACPEAAA
eukprot:7921969-Heterocapsa_arctica.AAC.1